MVLLTHQVFSKKIESNLLTPKINGCIFAKINHCIFAFRGLGKFNLSIPMQMGMNGCNCSPIMVYSLNCCKLNR